MGNVLIIDRTIPEIVNCAGKVGRLDLIEFCWGLKELGVGLFEINAQALKKLEKLPAGIDFVLRVECGEDINLIRTRNVLGIVTGTHVLKEAKNIERIGKMGLCITVEQRLDNTSDINGLASNTPLYKQASVNCVRLLGLNNFYNSLWLEVLEKVRGETGAKIDICPENRFFCASALAVEGIMDGADAVTLSFMGIGRPYGFAALEEVLAAYMLHGNERVKYNLSLLPKLASQYLILTGANICDSKPVIGRGIFRYESGIHADGIQKNPATYEPFHPALVGQERRLCIGKHSGRKSVSRKLEELGVFCSDKRLELFLEKIREKSISLCRELCDAELMQLLGEVREDACTDC
ncbi:MAG: citramalate synthase [Clostridia bacterium]|nr:citramalate synthase [Clostridia bacterium]